MGHNLAILKSLTRCPLSCNLSILRYRNAPYYLIPAPTNVAILTVSYILSNIARWKQHKDITYERIALIPPHKHTELIADLRTRTGLNIHRIHITSIDLLHDTAQIRVFYR